MPDNPADEAAGRARGAAASSTAAGGQVALIHLLLMRLLRPPLRSTRAPGPDSSTPRRSAADMAMPADVYHAWTRAARPARTVGACAITISIFAKHRSGGATVEQGEQTALPGADGPECMSPAHQTPAGVNKPAPGSVAPRSPPRRVLSSCAPRRCAGRAGRFLSYARSIGQGARGWSLRRNLPAPFGAKRRPFARRSPRGRQPLTALCGPSKPRRQAGAAARARVSLYFVGPRRRCFHL
ncbi:unnamed protein product, partial [Amoebophrya sp. A120]|eukprot:GSA120T00008461001.1